MEDVKKYVKYITQKEEDPTNKSKYKKNVKIVSKIITDILNGDNNDVISYDEFFDLDMHLVKGDKYTKSLKKTPKADKCPFSFLEGSSSTVAFEVNKMTKSKGLICIQIYGDNTYCACGLPIGWTTQEEATLRDTYPDLLGHLSAENFIEYKKDQKKFEYSREPGKDLHTSDGYIIDGKLCLNNVVADPGGNIINCKFLFSSMPSLSGASCNFDLNGAVEWLCKFRKSVNKPIDEVIARALVGELYKQRVDGLKRVCSDVFNKIMILIMFSEDYLPPTNPKDKKQLDGIIQTLLQFANYEKETNPLLKEGKKQSYEKAFENYKKMIHTAIRQWIILAREQGVKYFIGGPIGCGAFDNNPDVVAEIVAEEFVNYGGKMTFIYGAFTGEKDPNMKKFYNAFKKAHQNAS